MYAQHELDTSGKKWYLFCMLSGFTPRQLHLPPLLAQRCGHLPANSLASAVPTNRQTHSGVLAVPFTDKNKKDYQRRPMTISSPRLAPSRRFQAERALEARSLLMPEFSHNVLATRMLRISNLHSEMPRFRRPARHSRLTNAFPEALRFKTLRLALSALHAFKIGNAMLKAKI